MTKAQAKRRLLEARAKIAKVMMDDYLNIPAQDMKKMYDTVQYLGRFAAKLK